MADEISTPSRRNWQLHRKEQKNTYSLALVTSSDLGIGPRGRLLGMLGPDGAMEFNFPTNPKNLGLEEPVAVVIRPTQGGGQFVEHQGQIYKNVSIEGTTGLRPNPKDIKSISFVTGLNRSERTGFDDLIALRNLFRVYNAAKVDDELASKVTMVWKNGKEGEYYVVEPILFKTTRDASSPLTSSYSIQLRTIARHQGKLGSFIKDSYMSRNSPLKTRFFINEGIQALANGINVFNTFADSTFSAGARILTDILRPTNELFSALATLGNTAHRAIEIPRFAVVTLSSNLLEAINSLASANAIDSFGNYDAHKAELQAAMRSVRRAVTKLLGIPGLWATPAPQLLAKKKSQYIDSIFGNIDSGGDASSLNNENVGNGLAQGIIGANDNIRTLAKRLLGNPARWKALVIANSLKAPYISSNGDGIDVLRPGDYILYPEASNGATTAVSTETSGKHRTISPVEERLGRDIQLVPSGSSDVTLFDFGVSETGDIALVEGVPNMEQAVRIKFETEQGELTQHPTFGIKFPLGVKGAPASGFIEFDLNARSTLLSDPRVDLIKNLDITFEGNVLSIDGGVSIKGFDSSLSFNFATKR